MILTQNGKNTYKFDLTTMKWMEMPALPGSSRFNHAVVCHQHHVYVFGGSSYGNSQLKGTTYKTIVDNWRLNVKTKTWTRIRDTPIKSGNWNTGVVYKNRYVILVGGMGYKHVFEDEVKVWQNYTPKFNHPANMYNYRTQYSNAVIVYDINTEKFFFTSPLPMNTNLPLVTSLNDSLYILGGESGSGIAFGKWYGQHSSLVMEGKIQFSD